MNLTPLWTLLLGAAIVCAVLVIIVMVVHLARRFRREQRGFPVAPAESYTDENNVRPSHS